MVWGFYLKTCLYKGIFPYWAFLGVFSLKISKKCKGIKTVLHQIKKVENYFMQSLIPLKKLQKIHLKKFINIKKKMIFFTFSTNHQSFWLLTFLSEFLSFFQKDLTRYKILCLI